MEHTQTSTIIDITPIVEYVQKVGGSSLVREQFGFGGRGAGGASDLADRDGCLCLRREALDGLDTPCAHRHRGDRRRRNTSGCARAILSLRVPNMGGTRARYERHVRDKLEAYPEL